MPIADPVPSPKAGERRIPDLSSEKVREDYTQAACEAYLRLADAWRLSSKQACALIGEGSERTWFRIKANDWGGILSQDALTRVSGMIGIYKGLHLLFSDPLADEWVKRPNSDALFGGDAPADFMIKGGIPAILETRAYVDALRGGL